MNMVREVIAMVKTFYVNPETGELLSEERIADFISETLGTEDWMIIQKEDVTREVVVEQTTSELVFAPGEIVTGSEEAGSEEADSEEADSKKADSKKADSKTPAEGEGKIGDELMKIVSLTGVRSMLNKKIKIA